MQDVLKTEKSVLYHTIDFIINGLYNIVKFNYNNIQLDRTILHAIAASKETNCLLHYTHVPVSNNKNLIPRVIENFISGG